MQCYDNNFLNQFSRQYIILLIAKNIKHKNKLKTDTKYEMLKSKLREKFILYQGQNKGILNHGKHVKLWSKLLKAFSAYCEKWIRGDIQTMKHLFSSFRMF